MQNYSDDILNEVKRLSGLFFSPKEIAEMLELEESEFMLQCNIVGSAAYKSFKGGRYQGEIDVRTGIIKMAKAGSSPAQTMALDLLKKSSVKMLDR